jgi:hypothetical protein
MKAENLAPNVVSYRTLLYGYSIRGISLYKTWSEIQPIYCATSAK